MEFKPTKAQVLQAWEDRDEGLPLSKDMELYLDGLEQQEQANAQAAQESTRLAQRLEKVNKEVKCWKDHYRKFENRSLPEELERELRKDLIRRY